jgi:hypothetical protein
MHQIIRKTLKILRLTQVLLDCEFETLFKVGFVSFS